MLPIQDPDFIPAMIGKNKQACGKWIHLQRRFHQHRQPVDPFAEIDWLKTHIHLGQVIIRAHHFSCATVCSKMGNVAPSKCVLSSTQTPLGKQSRTSEKELAFGWIGIFWLRSWDGFEQVSKIGIRFQAVGFCRLD
jgi:hypothetical protein